MGNDMTGTLVNAAAIVAGGAVGLLAKKGIPTRMEDALHKAMGLAVIVIGINGVITNMVTVFCPAAGNCCWCSVWCWGFWRENFYKSKTV